ncbi:MAG: hypothetical protein AAF517_00630 [Planctomycetota bacterium]
MSMFRRFSAAIAIGLCLVSGLDLRANDKRPLEEYLRQAKRRRGIERLTSVLRRRDAEVDLAPEGKRGGKGEKKAGGGGGVPACAEECEAGDIDCGDTVSGELAVGDCTLGDGSAYDTWRFPLAERKSVRIDQTSFEIDSFLYLLDAQCNLIAFSDDCKGLDSCLELELEAGDYFLQASAFSAKELGTYSLSIECRDVQSPCTEACQVGSLTCAKPATGSLGQTECQGVGAVPLDTWSFEVTEAREVVSFSMTAEFFTPQLTLFDSNCSPLGEGTLTSPLSTSVDFQKLLPGTYYLRASHTGSIPASADLIGGLASARDPDRIFATSLDSILVIDPESWEIQGSFPHGLDFAVGVAVVRDQLWVSDFNATTINVLTLEGQAVRTIALGDRMVGLAGSNEFDRLFALPAGDSGVIVELNPEDGSEIQRFDAPEGNQNGAQGLAFDGDSLYYVNAFSSGQVFELDPDSGEVRSQSPVPGHPTVDGLTALRGVLYILDYVQEVIVGFEPSQGDIISVEPVRIPDASAYRLEAICPDLSECQSCLVGDLPCGDVVKSQLGACSEKATKTDRWVLRLPTASDLDIRVESEFPVTVTLESVLCEPIASADQNLNPRQVPGGTYYVSVTGTPGDDSSYSIQTSCEEFQVCASCVAGDISCGDTKTGELAPRDCRLGGTNPYDVWTFTLEETQRVRIDMSSEDFDTFLLFATDNCLQLAANDDCGETLNSCLIQDLEPGTYQILATAFSGDAAGTYQLTVECTDPIDFCSDCVQGEVTCGDTMTGELEVGKCSLLDGQGIALHRLSLPVESDLNVNLSSLDFDTVLFLFNEACEVIAVNDDCVDFNSCLDLRGLGAGEYYLAASSFDPGSIGRYSLSVDCGVDLCTDCKVGVASLSEINAGELTAGICIEEGTFIDTWQLNVPSDGLVSISLRSESFDPILQLRRGVSCRVVSENDDCDAESVNSCLELEMPAGTFALAVTSALPGEVGAYSLEVTHVPQGGLQRPADCDQSGRIDITDGVCILGHLFLNRPAELPCEGGARSEGNLALFDLNENGGLESSDAVRVFLYLFSAGEPPPLCDELSCSNCVRVDGCADVCIP